jgi:hypothetical protein
MFTCKVHAIWSYWPSTESDKSLRHGHETYMWHVLISRVVHRLLRWARSTTSTKAWIAALTNICCFHNEDGATTWMWKDLNITSLMLCLTFKKTKFVVLWPTRHMYHVSTQSEEIWQQQVSRIIWREWWVCNLAGVIRKLAENRASSWHVHPRPRIVL